MAGKINLEILKECREQLNFSIDEVQKKVETISKIENGEKEPTLNQLNILSKLYDVPRWIFIATSLPEKYIFSKQVPVFRKFKQQNQEITKNPKFCKFIKKIEDLRKFILETRQDIEEETPFFQPPTLENDTEKMAQSLREWLGIRKDEFLEFDEYRQKLENKEIFIFLTSKYNGWAKMEEKMFRGFAIYNPSLPIIIVNNSDTKKAQSFTLFHELGHLINKESSIDIDEWSEENWCDRLAGEFLVPSQKMNHRTIEQDIDLKYLDKSAKEFKVSPYAFLVRLKQLQKIDQEKYDNLEKELKEIYIKQKEELKKKKPPISRYRHKEIKDQYGSIYINSVSQLYYNKEINLHKLTQLLELKRADDALKIV